MILFVLLLLEALVWVFEDVVHEDRLGHIRVHERTGEDVRLEFLREETLHILINELLEQLIEEEERFPDIHAYLDGALDQDALLVLEVVDDFDVWLPIVLHLGSHGLPLCNELVNQVCHQ